MADNVTRERDLRVRLWFDPVCPWCWVTYLWLREVEKQRPILVDVALMSLAFLNEGKPGVPDTYRAPGAKSLTLGRVLAAAEATYGSGVLAPMYESMGKALHVDRSRDFEAVSTAALEAANVPTAIADAAGNLRFDAELRSVTMNLATRVGDDVGTPILEIGETTFFGPVLSRVPTAGDAGDLFDALEVLGRYPHFFELKRSRTEDPMFDAPHVLYGGQR